MNRIGLMAGLIAPPLFMSVVLAQDLLRRDFDPLRHFISELAIGPLGWIQILNFLVAGALIAIFARTLATHFRDSRAAIRGAFLLTIASASMFVSGMFVSDPMTPTTVPTWHGIIHTLFGLIVFALIPVSSGYFLKHFRAEAVWSRLRSLTLLTVIVGAAFWIVLLSFSFVPEVRAVIGLINRLVMGVWLLWIFLIALVVRKHASTDA